MTDFTQEGVVLLVDKPLGWTSFDVVKKIKFSLQKLSGLKRIKVGHAGTLDPLASGLLIVCTGRKTKIISQIQAREKEYTGIIHLGATTASYDLETKVENHCNPHHLKKEELFRAAASFEGEIKQIPPIFSAVKVNGKRAYELARKGQTAEIKEKTVQIEAFKITEIALPEIHFQINCSKGTYIRSIANDFGAKLGVGGYLKELCRTGIGCYRLEDALSIENLMEHLQKAAKV